MKTPLLLCALCGIAAAQDTFRGITLGRGPTDPESGVSMPTLTNNSSEPIIGYAVVDVAHGSTTIAVLSLPALAADDPLVPGQTRWIPGITVFGRSTDDSPSEYHLVAVLLKNGKFYGPDQVLEDFAHRVSAIRSMARDVQYSDDKFQTLAVHEAATPQSVAAVQASIDRKALGHASTMAGLLLRIRVTKGDDAVVAAITRLAALPDVVKGDEQ